MNKLVFIISFLFVFLIVTAMALSFDNPNLGRRVKFTNVSFAIRNSSNEIVNVTTNIPSSSAIKYTEKQITSQGVNTKVITDKYSLPDKQYKTDYQTSAINYKNFDDKEYDEALKKASKIKYENKEYGEFIPMYKSEKDMNGSLAKDKEEYVYDNVDWGRWKSNFVNKILDDSMYINELDNYPNGAFFYYSFIVDSNGLISDVTVRSVYLSANDKQIIKNFIKGYEHNPITKFPPKSNRKTAKVSAIMMLSSSETNYSKPSDFHDTERVKYKR